MHEDMTSHEDVVEHAHALEQGHVLKRAGDAEARNAVRLDPVQQLVLEAYGALLRRIETGHGIDQGRLASAIRTLQTVNAALLDVHADIRQRLQTAEATTDVAASQNAATLFSATGSHAQTPSYCCIPDCRSCIAHVARGLHR